MIIRIPKLFLDSVYPRKLDALFDSSACYSYINGSIAEELEVFNTIYIPLRLTTANEHIFKEINQSVNLDFYHDDICMSDESWSFIQCQK